MTLSAGSVSLGVKSDTKGFGKKLADDISKEAKSSGLSAVGKDIGNLVVAGVATAVAGIGVMIGVGIKETMDASAGTAQLAAGIKSTGNAANVSVKGMNDLASSIQNMSGQTDDSIVKAEQLLLTFTSIKNVGPDKIFDQATQAAADMAAKFGGDASSQAILLGKALNDPVKGITALTRVGVSFTAGQKETIAALVKSGDTMGAQKVILKELNSEFGGAAKAAGESLPGQLARGQRAFEDLSQGVVETFLPAVLPAITRVTAVLKDMIPFIQAGAKAVSAWLVQAWKDLQPAVSVVWKTLQDLGSFFVTNLIPAISAFGGWIRDNSTWLLKLAVAIGILIVGFKAYEVIMGVIKIATIAWTAVQAILDGTLIANPIGIVVMAIVALIGAIVWVATQTTFFQDTWTNTMTIIGAIWNWLWTTIIKPVVDFIVGYIHVLSAVFMWLWVNVIKPVADFIGGAIKVVGDVIGKVFGTVGNIIRGAFNGVVDFVRGIFNTINRIINNIIDGINGLTGLGGAIGINIGKIPHLPMLADGGTAVKPGSVIVGERGPEILHLPTGASVVPLDRNVTGSTEAHFSDAQVDRLIGGIVTASRNTANGAIDNLGRQVRDMKRQGLTA